MGQMDYSTRETKPSSCLTPPQAVSLRRFVESDP
jgi:hypothetical protein